MQASLQLSAGQTSGEGRLCAFLDASSCQTIWPFSHLQQDEFSLVTDQPIPITKCNKWFPDWTIFNTETVFFPDFTTNLMLSSWQSLNWAAYLYALAITTVLLEYPPSSNRSSQVLLNINEKKTMRCHFGV